MAARKTYAQFCALARALDHVGDRWTLLVVRELLLGPQTFRDLHRALAGIGPNLLVGRLRTLEADGLVQRNDAPARSKAVVYALTPAGAELEPAVLELIRWGARWMTTGPDGDRTDARWASLALRALLEGPINSQRRGVVHVDLGGTHVGIELRPSRRTVHPGRPTEAAAHVTAEMPELLAVVAGLTPLSVSAATVQGDRDFAAVALLGTTPPAP